MNDREQQSSVKAILIDFGGVLYKTPRPGMLPLLLRLFRRVEWEENAILLMMSRSPVESPLVMDLMTGKIAEKLAWEELHRAWRIPGAWFERMRRGASSPRRLNLELLEISTRLRPSVKTAVLTNAGTEFRARFVKQYRLDEFFDHVIISAEEGLAKPMPEIYFLAADTLGVRPEQAVFFDDLEENVLGARAAGMQAFQYQNNKQVLEILKRLM
jgi:putative hydrolase of the HAD superfamily